MNGWITEACGNTFYTLYAPTKAALHLSLMYLVNLRASQSWKCDSALLLTHDDGSVAMHVLESDGTISAMCGNGIRVVTHVCRDLGIMLDVRSRNGRGIGLTDGTHFACSVDVNQSGLWYMPSHDRHYPRFRVAGEPHVVIKVTDVDSVPLERWGKTVVPHSNLTVVARKRKNVVAARTFERGVNAITESCGTGACAAAHLLFGDSDKSCEVQMHGHSLHVRGYQGRAHLFGKTQIHSKIS